MFPSFLAVVDVAGGVDVGAIAERTTMEVGMSLKELALTCEYPDSSTLCRAFKGQAPLDLWHLRHAPIKWWQVFLMKLSSALIEAWWDTRIGERQMLKADLRSKERERVS